MLRFAFALLTVAALVPLTGCGGGQAQLTNDLKQAGLVYHTYHDERTEGPANWDEMVAAAEKYGFQPDSIRRIQAAGYEMTWSVKFDDIKGGLANTVLGKPPASGGPTLMMDGSVR
jgi:hypothetical protein